MQVLWRKIFSIKIEENILNECGVVQIQFTRIDLIVRKAKYIRFVYKEVAVHQLIGATGVLCECMSWNSLLVFLGRKIVSDCFHMHLWNHHLYLNPRNVTQSILPPGWNKDRSSFLFSFRHRCPGDIPNNSPKTDAQSSLVRSLAISFLHSDLAMF